MILENKKDDVLQFNLKTNNKPIIIYSFINPLCYDSWMLEVFMKKLALEYGHFFTVRPIITINPSRHNKSVKTNTVFSKINLGLTIKAAGLQGNKTGRDFLEKIQEAYFLYDDDLLNKEVIMDYASLINLDLNEFSNDIYSDSAKKAYQADLRLIKEMNIKNFPSLVFSSKHNEQHNLKVTGVNDYNSYVDLLYKSLNNKPEPEEKPSIDLFLKEQGILSIENIAFIYDWSLKDTQNKLNKLKLKGQVKELTILSRKYWSYNIKNDLIHYV